MSFARVIGAQPAIPEAHIVHVEADVSRGLHAFAIVGLPDKAVEEARDRISAAIKHSGFTSPKSTNKKIVISLAPAALKKEGAAFDVAIALAYLLAEEEIAFDATHTLFAGELSLDGTVRSISGVLSMTLAARSYGCTQIIVPIENAAEAALVDGIDVYGFTTLAEIITHVTSKESLALSTPHAMPERTAQEGSVSLEEIRGQEHAKRALEIAAAGRHNIAFSGPPGTGKTLLARALAGILPPLSDEEVIEVTSIHSIAGHAQKPIVHPPFRAPHHTASYASLIGGGVIPKPGEVTLAHRGVLFADEFPEFNRDVINALRQPLEDKVVSVSRVRGQAIFPANFMLVAALNPCPCGRFGTARCTCAPVAIERYRRKIAGPIADRIDMWVTVGDIPLETLAIANANSSNETNEARDRVRAARSVQDARFSDDDSLTTNSDMGPRNLERYSRLSSEAEQTALTAATRMRLSPRGYHRTIKLARTIADLAGSDTIETDHMLEALQYRPKE
jgi:magnesium chelatase family protein